MSEPPLLKINRQPDEITCGPTCLHAVYEYYKENISLEQVIKEAKTIEGGGTIAVYLGLHALSRGYFARIYTYNLQTFDPTWFQPSGVSGVSLAEKLSLRANGSSDGRIKLSCSAYVDFVKAGGEVRFRELTPDLIKDYLGKRMPILSGLSATYLYRCAREIPDTMEYDDIYGHPSGHFVVLCDYDVETHKIRIADPLLPNPVSKSQYYFVNARRIINSILLGIVTYDANILILSKNKIG